MIGIQFEKQWQAVFLRQQQKISLFYKNFCIVPRQLFQNFQSYSFAFLFLRLLLYRIIQSKNALNLSKILHLFLRSFPKWKKNHSTISSNLVFLDKLKLLPICTKTFCNLMWDRSTDFYYPYEQKMRAQAYILPYCSE